MPTTGVFVIKDDKKLVQMSEQRYDTEDLLQSLLADYPDLLAGWQIDDANPRRWLFVSREVAVPSEEDSPGRWPIDHVFLDQDAIPTFVEVKRGTDTRIRREVVGQMLDYAANAVAYLTEESLRAQFIGTWAARGTDPQRVLDDFLGPDLDPEAFWATAGTNLHAGKIRLVFVADDIPRELQRIVEFLNQQMDPAEVLGVEIKQYTAKGEGFRTLVPRVVGHLAQPRRTGGRQWDESSFFEDLARRSRGDVAPARAILAWAREKADWIWWGKGDRSGSFIPMFGPRGPRPLSPCGPTGP